MSTVFVNYQPLTVTVTTLGTPNQADFGATRAAGTTTTYPCRFEKRQKQVRRADGNYVWSQGKLTCADPTATFPEECSIVVSSYPTITFRPLLVNEHADVWGDIQEISVEVG